MDTEAMRSAGLPLTPFSADCPSRTVIDVLANKWVLYVLSALRRADRPIRFGELKRLVEGVTQKSLTKALRALERDGLVDREVYPTVPPRVEYRLTDLGYAAGQLLEAVAGWAVDNAPRIVASRQAFYEASGPTAPWITPRPVTQQLTDSTGRHPAPP